MKALLRDAWTATGRRSHAVTRDDVIWCYRTILRREPESEEVVQRHLASPSFRSLVSQFLNAAEHGQVAATRSMQNMLPAGAYLSLGTHCFSSAFLRRLGVRHWSGPFDWTFTSLAMVTHCLADDFAAFLDRSQYVPVPVNERPNGPTVNRVHHRYYQSAYGVGFVFNHHDVHLDEGYAYILRCVDRFREALRSPLPKVFLVTFRPNEESPADLQRLMTTLRERTTLFRVVAFAVDSDSSRPLPTAAPIVDDRVTEDTSLAAYRYSASSVWGPVSFADAVDETCMASVFAQEAGALMGTGTQPM